MSCSRAHANVTDRSPITQFFPGKLYRLHRYKVSNRNGLIVSINGVIPIDNTTCINSSVPAYNPYTKAGSKVSSPRGYLKLFKQNPDSTDREAWKAWPFKGCTEVEVALAFRAKNGDRGRYES